MHIITQPGTFQINTKKTHLLEIKRESESERTYAKQPTITVTTITTNDITEFIIAHTITLTMAVEQSAEWRKRERESKSERGIQKQGLYQMA